MELILGLRMGVLHCNLRAEFDMRSDRLTELCISGKARRVERSHVERDKPFSLLLGDSEVPVNIDEMGEPELSGEAIWTTKGFRSKGGEVIDVFGLPRPKVRLEQPILQDAAVKRVLVAMQRLFATCDFVERRHSLNSTEVDSWGSQQRVRGVSFRRALAGRRAVGVPHGQHITPDVWSVLQRRA
jgi:hypothetical protein